MPKDFTNVILNRQPMVYDHRDYRLLDYITPSMRERALATESMDWSISKILDQGSTGHCVGFAWAGFGISSPVCDEAWDDNTGHDIYYVAKTIDGEPGAENGSSTRSGVQAFMRFSKLVNDAYAFANSLDSIIVLVKTVGPIITGTNWYTDMFYPDSSGFISVGGRIEGGHEWMISGVDTTKRLFHCTNSWGTEYAFNGQFYIGFDDYERLFDEEGDAVTAAEMATEPFPEPEPVPEPIPEPTPEPDPESPGCLPRSLYRLARWTERKF